MRRVLVAATILVVALVGAVAATLYLKLAQPATVGPLRCTCVEVRP